MKTTWLSILFSLFISTPLFSQFIAIQKGDKVEVRDDRLRYFSSWFQ